MSHDLIVNPNFWLEPRRTGGEVVRAIVMAPVKGRGLQFFYLDRKEHAELFRLVVEKEEAFRSMTPHDLEELPAGHRESLFKIGVLIHEKEISRSVYFHCFLDEGTLEWLPKRHRLDLSAVSEPGSLIVNPTFVYQEGERMPPDLAPFVRPAHRFLKGSPLLWIENPGTGLRTAYWVEPSQREILSSFRAGLPPPASLGFGLRGILEMARILVPGDYTDECRKVWNGLIEEARGQFQSQDYVTLADLLPPLQIAALRKYFRDMVAEGYTANGDAQVTLRQAAQQESVLGFFHRQFAPLVSRMAGLPLKPSINYFYSYHSGAVLDRHVDIDEDQYGISLLLDYEPEPQGPSPWPLFLESPEKKEIRVSQEIGNAVFYDGCKLPHYRRVLPPGHRSSSLLFHFVPQDFSVRLGWA